MADKKLIQWYLQGIANGSSKKDLEKALLEQGYNQKDIEELVFEAEKKLPPKPDNENIGLIKPPDKTVEDILLESAPETEPEPEKEVKSEINKDSKQLWKLILLVILLGLIFTGSLIILLNNSQDIINWWDPGKEDELPPIVRVNTNTLPDLTLECEDTGKDFSSGCDEDSYVYYFATEEECPEDYSEYSKTPEAEGYEVYVCGAAKDKHGNIGVSVPLKINMDVLLPEVSIETKTGWINEEFTVDIKDHDAQSGVKECSYSISGEEQTRTCNASLTIDPRDCPKEGEKACTLTAYAIDNAGNKGSSSQSFNIDISPPEAEIIMIKPSEDINGETIVEGIVDIIGTALDSNMKEYVLEWKRENSSNLIKKSSKSVSGTILGTINTEMLSNTEYTLVLTVEDKTGKKSTSEKKITVQNTMGPCTPGEIELCSFLGGVCAQSQRVCSQEGFWSECDIESLQDYESTETECDDLKDNDCDWDTDEEDDDCQEECVDDENCENIGDSYCDSESSTIFTCGQCDSDPCIEVCTSTNCSDCSCSCGKYVDTNDESDVSCNDQEDNDCDTFTDCDDTDCSNDPICLGGCDDNGQPCPPDNCCYECDGSEGHCFQCTDKKDPEDSYTCEADDECGADQQCDEIAPESIATNNDYCCTEDCGAVNTVGTCTCSGGNCNGGYCSDGNDCYSGVACEDDGWAGTYCSTEDVCGTDSLVTGKACTSGGCTAGVTNTCQDTNNCEEQSCGGTSFNCTFDGTWEWRTSNPQEICGDTIDNDCDGDTDDEDDDCTSCKADGEACSSDGECCSYPNGACDATEGCYSCNGNHDQNNICRLACGSSDTCDGYEVGTITGRNCCMSTCQPDTNLPECPCSSSTCPNGWCLDSPNCYYNVQCSSAGWYGDQCINSNCSAEVMYLANCYSLPMGCSHPDEFWCTESNHDEWECRERNCVGYSTKYYCSYNGTGWAWRRSGYSQEAGNCDDGEDNDCDGDTDYEDIDCGGTYTETFETSIFYLHKEDGDGYGWYGVVPGGMTEGLAGRASPYVYRTFARWNISSIPDNAQINSVKFIYHCPDDNGLNGYIREIHYDPYAYEGNAQIIYDDCEDGTLFTDSFPSTGTNQEVDLESAAATDLEEQLDDDWFAIGITATHEQNEGVYSISAGVNANPSPTLEVNYTA